MPTPVNRMLPILAALLTLSGVPQTKPVALEVSRVWNQLTPNADTQPGGDFLRRRQRNGTHLKQAGPAPDLYKDPQASEDVRLTRYHSDGKELKIWHVLPRSERLRSVAGYPTVVFVHEGTSLTEDEILEARVFSEAGFLVLAPSFRGENGNPGVHELLFGELEDLVAAAAYATELPDVDEHKVAIWGHGLGGMLAALSSLVPDLGVRYTGSSAGLQPTSAFEVIPVPFATSEQERSARMFGPNIHHLRTPHWACVGEQDLAVHQESARLMELAQRWRLPLQVEVAPGDRSTSRAACTERAVTSLLRAFLSGAVH